MTYMWYKNIFINSRCIFFNHQYTKQLFLSRTICVEHQNFQNNLKLFNKILSSNYIKHEIFNKRFFCHSEDRLEDKILKHVEYEDEANKIISDDEYLQLYPRHWIIPESGHNVFIILPRQKWGKFGMSKDSAAHLLAESITLIKSLENWKIIGSTIISTMTLRKKRLLGTDNFELLVSNVKSNPMITAVFFVIDMLSYHQQAELEQEFGIPVYDRYSIVLKIFHEHARTKEAKLQIALAEIPYIKNTLRSMEFSKQTLMTPVMRHVGGPGQTWVQVRNELLKERRVKIERLLDKIERNREILKQNRIKKQFPIIAVVGYTNSGKTSLIKALTGDVRLKPKDVLFATLDVTVHSGVMPSKFQVLYADTVGFISHIPTTLIQSFKSTLKEISTADLIIHVCDISHPDYHIQKQTVHDTLRDINVPDNLLDTMVEVGNKIDLVDDLNHDYDHILISATKGIGLNKLLEITEKRVLENTSRLNVSIRVPNGGQAYSWLYKLKGLKSCLADPQDYNFLLINVVITKQDLNKFQHYFPDCKVVIESNSRLTIT